MAVATEQRTIADWLRLIQAEYLEMPGLQLTKRQIQRLWTLEPDLCDLLIDRLLQKEFLRKGPRDSYVLAARPRRD